MNKLFVTLLVILYLISCSEKEEKPFISLGEVIYITHNSCNIGYDASINHKIGVLLSKSGTPSFENNILSEKMVYQNQQKSLLQINGIEADTEYNVVLYIEDRFSKKMFFSFMGKFRTSAVEHFTDVRDQMVYPVIKIGDQHWFAADLKYAPEGGSWETPQGRLYTLEAASKAVPEGWRLPTDEDWAQLEKYLGMPDSLLFREFNRSVASLSIMQIGRFWWNEESIKYFV